MVIGRDIGADCARAEEFIDIFSVPIGLREGLVLQDGAGAEEASFIVVVTEEEGLFDEVAVQGASAVVAEDNGGVDGWGERLRA